MTLDQAIDRYTNNAEYERIHGSLQGCLDFKQLAEWLRELKKLRAEQKDVYEKGYEDGYCYALEDSH
jgi:hypothetical protein